MPLDLLSVIPLDYPNSPAINDTWTGSNGVVYVWNGTAWTVSGSGGSTAYLPLSGGTMTGPIVLAADPVTNPQAANKHYVDAAISLAGNYLGTWSVAANTPNISAGGSISNANYVATTVNPATPETVPVGVPGIAGMSVANGDRVIWAAGLGVWQILRNAGVTLAAADARYYAITNPSGYQTAANVTTALAPYAPLAAPVFTGDARAVTPAYGDNDTSIATTAFVQAAVAPYANNVGRNLLHNALFNVAQRGAGPFTTSTYTLDRWAAAFNSDTFNFAQQALSDATRTQIGDEHAAVCLANTFTGNAAAGAYHYIYQKIENVRRLADKTVTVSFWALAGSGTPKFGVSLYQVFGTGGSPSGTVTVAGQSVTLGTTFATRYSLTFVLPSVAGKVLGTNNDHSTQLNFWYSCGTTNAALSGNVGVQSGTFWLWGVQLEIGSVATPLDYGGSPQQQLAACQRFYSVGSFDIGTYQLAANWVTVALSLPVTMRAGPTLTTSATSTTNGTGQSLTVLAGASQIDVAVQAVASGAVRWSGNYQASADL